MTKRSTPPNLDPTAISPLWLVLVAPVVGVALGSIYGRSAFFLSLAGGALLGAILLFWRSLQSLTGDAPLTLEEAMGLGAPSAEEERKAAVLRALKDLEYERTVGKIDEDDYQELSTKYRAEARSLLQLVDDDLGPGRAKAEAQLRTRLTKSKLADETDSPGSLESEAAPDDDGDHPQYDGPSGQDDLSGNQAEKDDGPSEPAKREPANETHKAEAAADEASDEDTQERDVGVKGGQDA